MSDDEGDKILGVAYFAALAAITFLAAILLFFWTEWVAGLVALALCAFNFGVALHRRRQDE